MLGRAGERDPASRAGHRIYNSNSGKVVTMRHQTHIVLFLLVCLATQARTRYVPPQHSNSTVATPMTSELLSMLSSVLLEVEMDEESL